MYEVRDTADSRSQFHSLPRPIRVRVLAVFERLIHWPNVSGAKPLKHSLKGAYRVRTGDWRVLFTVDEVAKRVTVFRIAHRRDVYDE
jgi:mRNA interferase RelE/StbE